MMSKPDQSPHPPGDVTRFLAAHRAGDAEALDRVFEIVYAELRRLARHQLRSAASPTLSTTGLVNELYLKIVDRSSSSASDRTHFMALAARAMRQIVIDHARVRGAQKRGAGTSHVPFDSVEVAAQAESERLLELNTALHQLQQLDPRLVQVVECRFFAGLTEAETAEAMSTSISTVQRNWKRARGWLRVSLA